MAVLDRLRCALLAAGLRHLEAGEDPAFIAHALDIINRAKDMNQLATSIKQGLIEAIEHAAGQPSQAVVHPPKTIETMAIPNPSIKFTYEDYLNAPEDKRYELLDGDLVPIPSPGERHQSISILLGSKLVQFAYENSLGRVYLAPFDVVLSNVDVVQPDLLFVSNERGHIITPANIQGAPDLVVEILSPSTAERDRTFKRTLYAKHGVNEYWMVDTTVKDIAVLLLGERGYEIVDTYGEGETLTSPTLESFTLNIGDLF